jgi:hypothetical protein
MLTIAIIRGSSSMCIGYAHSLVPFLLRGSSGLCSWHRHLSPRPRKHDEHHLVMDAGFDQSTWTARIRGTQRISSQYLITSISQHVELNWLMWYSVTRTIYFTVRFSMRIWNIYLCIYSTGTLLLAVASWPVDQKGYVRMVKKILYEWACVGLLPSLLNFSNDTENTIKQPIDANLNHSLLSLSTLIHWSDQIAIIAYPLEPARATILKAAQAVSGRRCSAYPPFSRVQGLVQIVCKKKITRHIKIPAYA